MNEVIEILQLPIIGGAVSLVVSFLRNKFGTSGAKTMGITITISCVVGIFYAVLRDSWAYQEMLNVLAYASLVYAFILKELQDNR